MILSTVFAPTVALQTKLSLSQKLSDKSWEYANYVYFCFFDCKVFSFYVHICSDLGRVCMQLVHLDWPSDHVIFRCNIVIFWKVCV